MAKGIFEIHIIAKSKEESIKEVSVKLIDLYREMSMFDKIFNHATIYVSYNKRKFIDFSLIDKNSLTDTLSKYILDYNLHDIQQYDKIKNPTIDYKRDFGFRCVIEFGEKKEIHLRHIMGTSDYESISSFTNIDFSKDYFWYSDFLKKYVDKLDVIKGIIKITTNAFIKEACNYSFPLGWITYFSNESEIKIPDNLEGFEYEYTDKGKYLIATREDFTVSKEAYQEQKEKLLKTMEYLGKTVPGYLRNEEK